MHKLHKKRARKTTVVQVDSSVTLIALLKADVAKTRVSVTPRVRVGVRVRVRDCYYKKKQGKYN